MIPDTVTTNNTVDLKPVEVKISLSLETIGVLIFIALAVFAYAGVRLKK